MMNGKILMKKLALIAGLAACLIPATGIAQRDVVIADFGNYRVGENGETYKFQFVKANNSKTVDFKSPTFSDAAIGGWTSKLVQGSWGTLNKPRTDPCPLNIPELIKPELIWPSGRDLLIRIWIDESEVGVLENVRVSVALDNGVAVYWNGDPVGDPFFHDECAAPEVTSTGGLVPKGDGPLFEVEETSLRKGGTEPGSRKHLLAIHGVWLSAKNFLDVKVIADLGYQLKTTIDGPGRLELTINNEPPIEILPADNYTAFFFGDETIKLKAICDDPASFFGDWPQEMKEGPVPILTGWDGIPFGPQDDPFSNPVVFTMDRSVDVTATFSPLPPSQGPIYVQDGDIEGNLQAALEQAENYPGPDEIVFDLSDPNPVINLTKPLSASDLAIINESGSLVTIQPEDPNAFGSDEGFELSGVFVKWGYEAGGITLRGLRIQGFPGSGVCIHSDDNVVEGCEITGNGADGICIVDGNNNRIGGTASSQANQIFKNTGRGVSIRDGDIADQVVPSGNTILGNSIYLNGLNSDGSLNGALGIDFADRGGNFGSSKNRYPIGTDFTWEDYINDAQNFPDLKSAEPLSKTISGRLYGRVGATYRIEVFLEGGMDENGDPVPQELLEAREISAANAQFLTEGVDAGSGWGVYEFSFATTGLFRPGDFLVAAATEVRTDGSYGNSSEFSVPIIAGVETKVYGPVKDPDDPLIIEQIVGS